LLKPDELKAFGLRRPYPVEGWTPFLRLGGRDREEESIVTDGRTYPSPTEEGVA